VATVMVGFAALCWCGTGVGSGGLVNGDVGGAGFPGGVVGTTVRQVVPHPFLVPALTFGQLGWCGCWLRGGDI